jgi:chromosome segregation ATPase
LHELKWIELAMKDVETLVSGIDYKLKQLFDNHHHLREENVALKKKIEEFKSDINKYRETIKQLEEKVQLLKLAKTLESNEGNVEAKLKINELVREIDKCIGLLNT